MPGTTRRVIGLAKRVKSTMAEDNLSLVAAGVAFYSVLAVFPAIISVVTVYALVADPNQIDDQLRPVTRALPSEASTLLIGQLQSAAEASPGKVTFGLVLSLLGTVWAAAGGMSALMTGLNVIYQVPESRNFVKVKALALGLTFGAMIAVVTALGLVAAFPVALHWLHLGFAASVGAQVARWLVLAALVSLGLSVVYRWAPDRTGTPWRWLSWGSGTAMGVWIVASLGFSLYVSNFGSYDKTYGTLAAFIVLLMWFYLSAFAVLLGAQIDVVLQEDATGRDRAAREATDGPANPDEAGRRSAHDDAEDAAGWLEAYGRGAEDFRQATATGPGAAVKADGPSTRS